VSLSAADVADDARCGIYLIDWSSPSIRSFSAPGLPTDFSVSLTGMPLRKDAGPCARAACLGTPVIVEDLESDPRWQGSAFSALAATHGLRSCWSTPICAADKVLGVLAILHAKPGSPTLAQEDRISRLVHIASVAIKLMQVEAELDKTSAALAHVMKVIALGASIAGKMVQPLSGVVITASACRRMLSACPPNVEGARETVVRTLRDCGRASEMVSQLRDVLGLKSANVCYLPGNLDRA
jgi:hypothetical protein